PGTRLFAGITQWIIRLCAGIRARETIPYGRGVVDGLRVCICHLELETMLWRGCAQLCLEAVVGGVGMVIGELELSDARVDGAVGCILWERASIAVRPLRRI